MLKLITLKQFVFIVCVAVFASPTISQTNVLIHHKVLQSQTHNSNEAKVEAWAKQEEKTVKLDKGTKEELPVKTSNQSIETISDTPNENVTRHHVVKLNLLALLLQNISGQYEFAFHKNLSVAIGANILTERKVGQMFEVFIPERDQAQGEDQGFKDPVFKGWSIKPEFRFYPGKKQKHQAPHGFYLAPYARFSQFTLNSTYSESYLGITSKFDFTTKANLTSGGLMIGAQWLLGKQKRISLDWWILGLDAGVAKITMSAKTFLAGYSLDQAQQDDLKKELETTLSEFSAIGLGDPKVETTGNSFKVELPKVPFAFGRGFGFCVGFAF
jgi:hypothetical protein